jgi:hypothetical protein
LLEELENLELDQPIEADIGEGIIIAGYRWQTKCTECLEFVIENDGEYAECGKREEPHNCEGPYMFQGETWTSRNKI